MEMRKNIDFADLVFHQGIEGAQVVVSYSYGDVGEDKVGTILVSTGDSEKTYREVAIEIVNGEIQFVNLCDVPVGDSV